MQLNEQRLIQRVAALDMIEKGFIAQQRGGSAEDHRKVLKKTVDLMTSAQMEAFKVDKEPEEMKESMARMVSVKGALGSSLG